jgi:uncharacterized protein (DUF2336 family)
LNDNPDRMMTEQPSRFAMLADMSSDMSSEDRRELLRKVTAAMAGGSAGDKNDLAKLDEILAGAAADYAVQVRGELAKLVAGTPAFGRTASMFALDDIEVAAPILRKSRALSDTTLLKVIAKNSQPHMMAVTQRQDISPEVSHALVEAGDDHVVVSLLSNDTARIAHGTFEAVTARAQNSTRLQAPLVRRKDVPIEMLNELYLKVESGLRLEILTKYNSVSGEEIDKAFQRSRSRVGKPDDGLPPDFRAAQAKIGDLTRRGFLTPPSLAGLLREGTGSRTAFNIAFAQLADVEFDLVQRTVAARDLDTVALLCRGARFDRALYLTIAIALKDADDRAGPSAQELGALYETVPVQAAQRALRFWKARTAA